MSIISPGNNVVSPPFRTRTLEVICLTIISMCLSAIYWSHIDKVFYANTRDDAKNIDFDDSFIYSEINKKIDDRKIQMVQLHRDEALKAFKIWDQKVDKIKY